MKNKWKVITAIKISMVMLFFAGTSFATTPGAPPPDVCRGGSGIALQGIKKKNVCGTI